MLNIKTMYQSTRSLFTVGLMTAVIIAPTISFAMTETERKGLEIAKEADARDQGFIDSKASLTMTLRNQHGDETVRKMHNRILEQADDGDKSIIVFDTPKDVKGTAFLSFTHRIGADDQWIFLPSLKRVKRISSSNKAGPFMGSEFAYEDLASQEVAKYTYNYLSDERFDGRDHFMLERFPTNPKSGYSRQVVWIDKVEYLPWKIDFYDRKGVLLKTLTNSGYEPYFEKYWRVTEINMINHQTGKSTQIIFDDYQFGNGFSDREFSKNALAKAR